MYSRVQVGIFKGRGLIHKNSTLKVFNENIAWTNIFQLQKQKKHYRNFPHLATFKFNDGYKQRRCEWGARAPLASEIWKIFGNFKTLYQMRMCVMTSWDFDVNVPQKILNCTPHH